jgi:hypothetical protein
MHVLAIPPGAFRRRPWKNGGGVSVTIAEARLPQTDAVVSDDNGWDTVAWQFGFTSIERPGPFSDLSGFERLQTVVDGHGLVLETPGCAIDLRTPLTVARYDGGLPIVSRLEAGPVGVVNLIARRAVAAIGLTVLRSEAVTLGPGVHLAYAFGDAAMLEGDGWQAAIPAGHAARIDGVADIACSKGCALLATVTPREAGGGP